jgi:flagellar biosynthesis chaperone FliJ
MSQNKNKLHAVLAVDRDLENTAKKIVEEATNTFTKKSERFFAFDKRLKMFDEKREGEENAFHDSREMVTTVVEKLDYVAEHLIRHLDALAQKERTNQDARADVVLPNKRVLLKNVPATLLLSLESRLITWRKMYESIPTLQPGIKWVLDADMGNGIYKEATGQIKSKTEKTIRHKVLYEATKEHPAQIEKWNEDIPVGQYITLMWSGMVSSAKKSELLKRIDEMIAAVKQARTIANSTEVIEFNVGEAIFNYIHNGASSS